MAFRMGDHQFLDPAKAAPLSRMTEPPRQILGAPPPNLFDGVLREANSESPAARELFKGHWRGHSEPTITIFDVVIDGVDQVEVGVIQESDDDQDNPNPRLLVVRKRNGNWITLFRREWGQSRATLENIPSAELTEAEIARIATFQGLARVVIGFEYPCDATSRDCISWITIHAQPSGQAEPVCLVDAELA